MADLDLDALLKDLSADAPCGEDLEYDPAFVALERSAEGKPEQQYGDTIIAAEDPNWKVVRDNALAVLRRSKDLRATLHLTRALAHIEGWPGLASALALLRGQLERYWDSVHPQLDPEDDNDPTLRVNTIAALADRVSLLLAVEQAPLVRSRTLGNYSLHDYWQATEKVPAPAGIDEVPKLSAIDSAFQDCDVGDLRAMAQTVSAANADLNAIESVLTERVGVDQAVDLGPLRTLLREAGQILDQYLKRREDSAPASPQNQPGEISATADQAAPTAAPARAGAITGREDIARRLDEICDWFQLHEPSSPVPLLLQRAKRLMGMDFMAILQDLAPKGVAEAEQIRGPDGTAKTNKK